MSDSLEIYQPASALLKQVTVQEIAKTAGVLMRFAPSGRKLQEHEASALALYSMMTGFNAMNNECYYMPGVGPTAGVAGYRVKAKQYNRIVHGVDTNFTIDYRPAEIFEADFRPGEGDVAWVCELTDTIAINEWDKNMKSWLHTLIEAGIEADKALAKAEQYAGKRPVWSAVGVVDHREHFTKVAYENNKPQVDEKGNPVYKPEMWDRNERAKKRAEKGALKKRYPDVLIPDLTDLAMEDNNIDTIISNVVQALADKPAVDRPKIMAELGFPTDEPASKQVVDADPEFEIMKRPWLPERVKLNVKTWADEYERDQPQPIDKGAKGAFINTMTKTWGSKANRYAACDWLTGKGSSLEMGDHNLRALKKWYGVTKDKDTGEWIPGEHITKEAGDVLRFVMKEQGQETLPGLEE